MNKLFQRSRILGMEFNAKRCKVLRMGRIRSIDDGDYYHRVDVGKDLGILARQIIMLILSPRKLKKCFVSLLEHVGT